MAQLHTYLSKEDFERLSQICEAEQCTPYMLAKIAILDKIHSYNLKEKATSHKDKSPGQAEKIPLEVIEIPKKSSDERAREIADAVRQLL
jgi:hypothetical protein